MPYTTLFRSLTAVTPVKFVPLMVTFAPTGPLVGEKLVMVGGGMTVKLVLLVAVPADVVAIRGPVVAPAGTVAWITVVDVTVKVVALVPLKLTAVTPVKFVPLMVTFAPTGLLVGEKLVMVGGGMTVKLVLLVPVPADVVTLSGPVVAPAGTVAWITVVDVTVKVVALVPLKLTAVTPVKFVPLMVTFAPTGPLVGVKSVIVGALADTVKVLALVAVPPDVVTL